MNGHPEEQLSAYLDGELPAEERAVVEAHLRTCGACARALAEMRAIDAASRILPVEAPEGYFDALPGRVRRRVQAGRTTAPRRALWAVAAAAVLAAVVTPVVLRRAPAPAAQPVPLEDSVPPATLPAAPAPPATSQPAVKAEAAPERGFAEPKRPAPPAAEPPPAAAPVPAATAAPTPPLAFRKGRPQEKQAEEEKMRVEDLEIKITPSPAPAAEPQARRDRALERNAASREVAGFATPPTDAEYRKLASRRPASADEARALRDAWRAWAQSHPEGTAADEARVRTIAAGAEAWRLGHDERDRSRVRADAEAYLQRPDARQAERVRRLLEAVAR